MRDYINKILIPYIKKKRTELKLPSDQRALVLFDKFKGQCTSSILELLEENNISVVMLIALTGCNLWMSVSTKLPRIFYVGNFRTGMPHKFVTS